VKNFSIIFVFCITIAPLCYSMQLALQTKSYLMGVTKQTELQRQIFVGCGKTKKQCCSDKENIFHIPKTSSIYNKQAKKFARGSAQLRLNSSTKIDNFYGIEKPIQPITKIYNLDKPIRRAIIANIGAIATQICCAAVTGDPGLFIFPIIGNGHLIAALNIRLGSRPSGVPQIHEFRSADTAAGLLWLMAFPFFALSSCPLYDFFGYDINLLISGGQYIYVLSALATTMAFVSGSYALTRYELVKLQCIKEYDKKIQVKSLE
jgi:hypothetical protein